MAGDASPQDVTAPGTSAIPHVPALDGLRGVAIALVLAIHFGVGAALPQHWPGVVSVWLERLCYVGWSGVDLFFVLSGFLITSILLASATAPGYYQRFYSRRALRIFPLYFVALGLGLIVLPRVLPSQAPALLGEVLHHQLWLWTYTLNVANALGWVVNAGVLGQMWSLAIEEQFYAVWPLVARHLAARRLLLLCGVLAVMALALRVAWIRVGDLGAWPGPYRFTLTRVDALAAGAALAVLRQDPAAWARVASWARVGLAVTGGTLVVWFLAVPRFYPDQPGVVTVGHSLLALAFSCLVVRALGEAPPRWMCGRVLTTLGKYSYGIYVWHWPVQFSFVTFGKGQMNPAVFIGGGLVATCALALVSYHLLEAPFLRLKDRVGYGAKRLPVLV